MKSKVKIIFVNSAKGGVGKTRVTKVVARMLRDAGNNVAIMDLDVTTPNSHAEDGIPVVRFATTRMPTKTRIVNFIRRTIKDLEEGYLIVDTPPTISETYLAVAETIRGAMWLFVTTPDDNAIKDTVIGINFFVRRGIKPAGIFQNLVGTFGDEFDSLERMNINTIAVVRKDHDEDMEPVLPLIESFDFSKVAITEEEKHEFESRYTAEYVIRETERDKSNFPLRFYNLETWDVIRRAILKEELAIEKFGGLSETSSYFDIPTKTLEPIVQHKEGTEVSIRIYRDVHVEPKPLVGSVMQAKITYKNNVSKGLPMFVLPSGVHLWVGEADLISEDEITTMMENGYLENGDGVIVPPLYEQLLHNRIISKINGTPLKERELELFREHKLTTNVVDAIAMLAELEDGYSQKIQDNEPFTIEGYKSYVKELIDDGVEYAIDGGQLKHIADIEAIFKDYQQ